MLRLVLLVLASLTPFLAISQTKPIQTTKTYTPSSSLKTPLTQLRLTPGNARFSVVLMACEEDIEISGLAINEAYEFVLGSMDFTIPMDREIIYDGERVPIRGERIHFVTQDSTVHFKIRCVANNIDPVRAIAISVMGKNKNELPGTKYKPQVDTLDSRGLLPPKITTSTNITATNLVKNVLIGGDCFEVTNVTYSGDTDARGTFNL